MKSSLQLPRGSLQMETEGRLDPMTENKSSISSAPAGSGIQFSMLVCPLGVVTIFGGLAGGEEWIGLRDQVKMAVVRAQRSKWKFDVNGERKANERMERTKKSKDRKGLERSNINLTLGMKGERQNI